MDSLTLPPHQRCAAHTLNLIATVDILAAENEGAYKRISRRVFGKCQSLFNKQNQSSQCADQIKAIFGRYILTPNATRYIFLNLLVYNLILFVFSVIILLGLHNISDYFCKICF